MRREVKLLPIILFVVSCLLLLPLFIYSADWAGWLLVYFSLVIPLFFARIRRDRKLLLILIAITAIHNGVSIYNVYATTVFGADVDAVKFQDLARDLTTEKLPLWFTELDSAEIGASAYTRFLASFYRLFGISLLLGQSLSVIAYTLSCVVLVYLAYAFRFRFRRELLIMYGLSAPAIIYCSIIMREAWQVLFFLLVIYLTIQLRIAPSILRSVLIVVCGLVLGLLHNGLFIYSLFLIGLSLYWGMSGKWRKAGYKKVMFRAIILFVAFSGLSVWLYFGGEIGGATKAIRTGDAISYTETYRERGAQDAAANYQVKVDVSSPLTFALTGTQAFIYYQFAPFPWQVNRPLDAYAAFEGFLRLIFMIYAVRLWWRARGERRQRYTYLIITYVSLEFLWALGTGNWGTAVRHHVVAYGVIALLAVPSLAYTLQQLRHRLKFSARRFSRRSTREIRGIRAAS